MRDDARPDIQLGEALQLHIIELRKAERLRTVHEPLRAWITCLLHNRDEVAMSTISHPPVKEALEHLKHMYSDEEFRLLVERREQGLVDAEDMLDYARHEGAVASVATQITHKFGPLPDWASTRLTHASDADLKRWTLRVLDAQNLEDIFA